MSNTEVELNGRIYSWPKAPVVGVCIDGSEPGYIEAAVKSGVAPFFKQVTEQGTNRLAQCVVPSFTNPNNISIVTGRPPAVHGICGNFFYDRETESEVMMNEPEFLRVETIFSAFQRRGRQAPRRCNRRSRRGRDRARRRPRLQHPQPDAGRRNTKPAARRDARGDASLRREGLLVGPLRRSG